MNPLTDQIAHRAAVLLMEGESGSIDWAIHEARRLLDGSDVPAPGPGRVRQHLAALLQERGGQAAYDALRAAHLEVIEEVMGALEWGLDDARLLLAGRAAQGKIDGPGAAHMRVYTRATIGEIAALLVDVECPEPAFETVDSRHGRLERLRVDVDGQSLVLTRCQPELWGDRQHDLVTGARIATASREAFAALRIASSEPDRA